MRRISLEVLFFGASGSEVESVEESSRDPGTLRGADVDDMLGATTRPMDGKTALSLGVTTCVAFIAGMLV